MKTIATIILTVVFPLVAVTQAQNLSLIKLKTLDERTVDPKDIFQDDNLTIVYFFNEKCRNLTDQFEYLENLSEVYSDFKLKVIAVYNASSNSSYSQIKPFISGHDIGLEILIDINGELQRAMGLPVNTNLILTRYSNLLSGSYVQSVSYSPEQADVELVQLLSMDNHNSSDTNPYLSDHVITKHNKVSQVELRERGGSIERW